MILTGNVKTGEGIGRAARVATSSLGHGGPMLYSEWVLVGGGGVVVLRAFGRRKR